MSAKELPVRRIKRDRGRPLPPAICDAVLGWSASTRRAIAANADLTADGFNRILKRRTCDDPERVIRAVIDAVPDVPSIDHARERFVDALEQCLLRVDGLDAVGPENGSAHPEPEALRQAGLGDQHALSRLGVANDAHVFAGDAMRLAVQGHHDAAFAVLATEIERSLPRGLERAMLLMPTWLYVGHRFVSEGELSRSVRRISLKLDRDGYPRRTCLPGTAAALCVGQVAVALNERGDPRAAGGLFTRPELRPILQGSPVGSYFQPQLIRNFAQHRILHGHDPDEGLTIVRPAEQWRSPGNQRAVATIHAMRHLRRGDYAAAWEAMQSHYDAARKVVRAAAESSTTEPDVFHAFANVFAGALTRMAARELYPPDDLATDRTLLAWCGRRFARLQVESLPYCQPSVLKRLDDEYRHWAQRTRMTEYTPSTRAALVDFANLVTGLS